MAFLVANGPICPTSLPHLELKGHFRGNQAQNMRQGDHKKNKGYSMLAITLMFVLVSKGGLAEASQLILQNQSNLAI